MDQPFEDNLKKKCYNQFFKTLKELDMEGVELIPQTMAPFPWHFGGQRFQNLFVKIDEIVEYCQKYNLRMCFDVSHSMLTSNYFNDDFYDLQKSFHIQPISTWEMLQDSMEKDFKLEMEVSILKIRQNTN